MELVFRDVCVKVDKKLILNNVSGLARSGELLAVMGPSGAGKSTLLNTLAGRTPMSSGTITVNGQNITKDLRRKICYVLQQDIFFSSLTLRETLQFTARIRLPEQMSTEQITSKVNEIIEDLDLTRCVDTIMGDMWVRGLSGGERKRASIACELVTDPVAILLDEPTSGLDYSTAFSLVAMIQAYAKNHNKTVVATIHQPSSYIFYQFHKLLLISNGELAYFGDTEKVVDFFHKANIPMASHYNPADFILEKLKEDEKTRLKVIDAMDQMRHSSNWPSELRNSEQFPNNKDMPDPAASDDTLEQPYNEKTSVHVSLMELDKSEEGQSSKVHLHDKKKWPTGFFTQYTQLTLRTFKTSKSQIFSKFKLIETVVLTCIVSLIWFQLPRTEETLRDRLGVLFYMSMHWGFTPLFDTVTAFPMERLVISKERLAGWYRLSAYYLAKMTSELVLILIQPLFFITIIYWSVGLNGVASYFATLGTLFLHAVAGQSIGLFIGIASMDIRKGMTKATIFIMATMLLGGFYTRSLPFWLDWIKYLSFLQYTFSAMLYLEFNDGPNIRCALRTDVTESQFGTCLHGNSTSIPSNEVLHFYGIHWPYWTYILPLFVFIFVFRVGGYFMLRYRQKPAQMN
uniref:ABC transporter G family member 22-like n=1 Tax=Crassostrea virginica TaxID=6565 RepID=A0A8B8AGB1_CRAVI|nr:ABC transporter G family member 22-like [Crassostrea virginica]XP_022290391.1 ABC transporter G family member 22-like [Crassostrea virginica]XP_022290399.1 ABC transporter G family member 22-like [Crassostrea virginica]